MPKFDEKQADLFDHIAELTADQDTPFCAKDLASWLDITQRQAQRIIIGASGLSLRQTMQIIRSAPAVVADAVSDYIHASTNRITVDISEDEVPACVDLESIALLQKAVDFAALRAKVDADGTRTPDESDELSQSLKTLARTAMQMNARVVSGPNITRKHARPLKLAKEG